MTIIICNICIRLAALGKPRVSSTENVFKIEAETDIHVNVWTDMQSACGIQTVWYSIRLNAVFDNTRKTVAML